MDARFVAGLDGVALREDAVRAEAEGRAAVIVRPGPLGDPVVLAAGLGPNVPRVLLGACVALGRDGRHPALVAREFTSLDHACGGRSMLCCAPPFDDAFVEALALCRAMWRVGHAVSDGPAYPVPHARHRPRPAGPASPTVALDLTDAAWERGDGAGVDDRADGARDRGNGVGELALALADFLLQPTDDPAVSRLVRP